MLDIRLIERQPDVIKRSLEARGEDPSLVDRVIELNARRKKLTTELNNIRARKNELAKMVPRAVDPQHRGKLIEQSKALDGRIRELERGLAVVKENLQRLMLAIPNLVDDDVPIGPDETHNVVVKSEGGLPEFDFEPLPHWELAERLRVIDFERGVKIAGSRFYVLKGPLSMLERALINFFLDYHIKHHGYKELYVPSLVRGYCLEGAGQLPKFADNLYRDYRDDLWLVPTAEVPLTNLYRDEILPAEVLPLSYVAYTPCFRREKMHAGRDVRGIKRGHQFDKVEMYKFCLPEQSKQQLWELVESACDILRQLKLPFRVVKLCSGDLGFAASETYDIEVWAAGCREWLEVSSCSNCRDFQARRANIRFRRHPKAKPEYVHTLNGSGLALPRVVIAIMENYQNPDHSITVPDALRPYMHGLERITPCWEY